MNGTRSVIHQPESQWAKSLQLRALAAPQPHDHGQLLDLFRAGNTFYQERINIGTTWSDITPLDKLEIEQIPVTDDPTLRASRTSGTTGIQVTIRNTLKERQFRRALLYRPQLFYDLPHEVRQVVFVDGTWCATSDMPPKYFEYGDRNYRTWFAGAGGKLAEIAQLLTDIRPQLIRGISSGIIRFIEMHGASMADLGVRYVAPGGEFLNAQWRAMMEHAFNAEVLDRYGSTESGAIAWQCPHCYRYHANVDEIILEADPDGLLATPLFIESQPLLRYRLGDMISFDDTRTDCRVRLPTIRIEAARRDDWIIDGAGNKVSPLSFQFEKIPDLAAWRLHQDSDGALCLYFDSPQPEAVAAELCRQLTAAVPGRAVSTTRGLWKLDRTGKFKRISSDLWNQSEKLDAD
jgi:phenylacetate-coenzyme A ligase PaaK-like adenylate-forming protein